MFDNLNMDISCINVKSFNLSSRLGIKKYAKIEAVTRKRADIILMSDCRVGNNKRDVEKLFRMSRNGNYSIFCNSGTETRGTCITIREGARIKIEGKVFSNNEEYILLTVNTGGKILYVV
jgi:hypothetical protein